MKIRTISVTIILFICLSSLNVFTANAKDSSGKDAFMKYKCNTCHSVKNENIIKKASKKKKKKKARVAPDLSGVGIERDMEWLNSYQMKKIKIDGKKHPKKFKGTDKELKAITNWMLGLKKSADGAK